MKSATSMLLATMLLAPRIAMAQETSIVSFALAVGVGPRTERSGDVYYRGGRSGMLRFSSLIRLPFTGKVRPVLHMEAIPAFATDRLSDCPLAPNGTCREHFPSSAGIGAAVGAAMAHATGSTTLLVGAGKYGDRSRKFAEAETAFLLSRSSAATFGLRYMAWTEVDGRHHWFSPLFSGIRVQF
jgi:hypothetical protein